MNNNLPTQEEISIMDLAIIIVKRKKSVFISLLFLGFLSTLYTLNYEDRYGLTSIVEIGSNSLGDLVEGTESVKLKLAQGLIPSSLDLLEKEGVEDASKFSINVSSPRDSTIVVLESKITRNKEKQYIDIHRTVINKLVDQHKMVVDNKNALLANQGLIDNGGQLISSQSFILSPSKIQVNAQKSKRPVGLTTFHVAIAGVLISVFLSLLTPLVLEFFAQVKLRVND